MIGEKRFKGSLVWLILLILVVFFCGRAHYFAPSLPQYHFFPSATDAAWHWSYQSYLADQDSFKSDTYQKVGKFRFPTDIFFHRLIIKLSQNLSLPRFTLNSVISTGIYLLTFVFLYLLGLAVLKEPKWAFFFGLLVSQSMYVAWLRYPVFVPKMLGFMMYPLVLYALVKLKESPQKYWLFMLISIVTFILYPASAVYYFPVILPLGFLYLIFSMKEKKWNWHLARGYIFAAAILLCTMFIFLYPRHTFRPPPLYVTEYAYKNHLFFFPRTFLRYCKEYGDYFLLSIVALVFLLKKGKENEKETAILFFGIFMGCILIGVITHSLSVVIPTIRLSWFWRIAYYSYVPGLLLIAMAYRLWSLKIPSKSIFSRILVCLVAIILLAYVAYHTPIQADTLKGTIKTLKTLQEKPIYDKYEQEMYGLIEFAKGTPQGTTFFLPHRSYQRDTFFDLFMVDSERGCFGHFRGDQWLFITEMEGLTQSYYDMWQEYDKIENLQDKSEFNRRLIILTRKANTSYIIHPQKHRFRLLLPCVYEDSFWIVYKIN